jgi:1-aminocyclopropane-1-carboxylate synthase
LNKLNIPYISATGGIFLFANLQSCLKNYTFEAEDELRIKLFSQCRVTFTPGAACHNPEPGYFRICYAWVTPETLQVAMNRFSALVCDIKGIAPIF